MTFLLERLMILVPLVLSLTVHEWAHAYSAYRLGDDTAARDGRLTLNPIVHMDPIGTFALPMLGVPFGWAKPVPVNPARFRRDVSMSTGMMLTAAAGPASNLLIAIASAILLGLGLRFGMLHFGGGAPYTLLIETIKLNVALAIFNMLPIPPLDGSRIVDHFIPYRWRPTWERFAQFSAFALIAVVFLGAFIFAVPMSILQGLLGRLIAFIAGA